MKSIHHHFPGGYSEGRFQTSAEKTRIAKIRPMDDDVILSCRIMTGFTVNLAAFGVEDPKCYIHSSGNAKPK